MDVVKAHPPAGLNLCVAVVVLGRAAAVDPPAATGSDDAELLHIDVHQLAGAGALIAADQLPGRAVQASRFMPCRRRTAYKVEGARPTSGPILAGRSFRPERRASTRASTSLGVLPGRRWARLGGSSRPARPSARQRASQNALVAHPDVGEVAVVGVADLMMGEKVGAVVVPLLGRTLDGSALVAFAPERLADFKVPRYVAVRSEPLPRNPGGKVLKPSLRVGTDWQPVR